MNKNTVCGIGAALLLCAFAAACTTDSEALKAVEGWYFTRYYGSLTGGTEGQFDQYDSQFLSDSQWNGIKSYSKQEDGDTNVTWYGVVSWMTNQGFSQEVIDKLKEQLASNERAVYVYARSAAGYNVYWLAFGLIPRGLPRYNKTFGLLFSAPSNSTARRRERRSRSPTSFTLPGGFDTIYTFKESFSMAQHQFQTEVSQLLHLIIHSLYSNREIFLREIVSNASDALDKLKYLTVADDNYKEVAFEPRIDISFDTKARTLTISDNGIGMNEQDLAESLGTIARSGTKAFLSQLSEGAKKDSNLIGQFGVGFYSAFMVSDKIEVISRKALENTAWKWTSDGKEGYEIESAERSSQGTTVILYLNDEGIEFADRWRIENIVKQYSNHVAFAIFLTFDENEHDDKGEVKSVKSKTERINDGTAIWRKSKSDLKEDDYYEFYKQIGHDSENPLFYLHTKAEGSLEYNTLFYIPKKAPFDMFNSDYKPGVKLYVKRVFITDDDKELMPTWLRFVRGVIDSEDLPLNVSREILQQNKILFNIRNASVKKLLAEFKSIADNDKVKWEEFITQYNRPLKEGLYSDWSNMEALSDLVRFKSTKVEGWTSLAEYTGRMQADQKYIYYITGGDEKSLKASPLLEAYRAKDIEVLVMDEEIDEIVIPRLFHYRKVTGIDKDGKETAKEWDLKSVNRVGADEELGGVENKGAEDEAKPVIEKIKLALGDKVKDVRLSRRLHDSPSCIVADENDPSMQMAQMLKAMGQTENMPEIKPILEVNGSHPLVSSLADIDETSKIEDTAVVLLSQALLVEGLKLPDTADFVQRLNRLLSEKAAGE